MDLLTRFNHYFTSLNEEGQYEFFVTTMYVLFVILSLLVVAATFYIVFVGI